MEQYIFALGKWFETMTQKRGEFIIVKENPDNVLLIY